MKFRNQNGLYIPADAEARAWHSKQPSGIVVSLVAETEKSERKRTPTQNNCIYDWAESCAEYMNMAGLDMKKVLKEEAEIPWTKQSFVDNCWREVQLAMYQIESTRDISTVQCTIIHEVVNRHINESQGVQLPPWPTRFNGGGK